MDRHGLSLQAQIKATQGGQSLHCLAACTGHIRLGLAEIVQRHAERVMRIGVQLDGVRCARDGRCGRSAAAGQSDNGHGLDSWLNQANHRLRFHRIRWTGCEKHGTSRAAVLTDMPIPPVTIKGWCRRTTPRNLGVTKPRLKVGAATSGSLAFFRHRASRLAANVARNLARREEVFHGRNTCAGDGANSALVIASRAGTGRAAGKAFCAG